MSSPLYYDLNTELRKRFGCRVQKISLDAGLSCPNRDGRIGTGGCIYCNSSGSGTGASEKMTLKEQIAGGKEFLRRRYHSEKFIAYFQSFSNTYARPEKLRAIYSEALDDRDIAGLAIGTRPDCADEDVLDVIAEFSRKTYVYIEYGLQSVHDRTLNIINRGHDFSVFVDAVHRTRARGIEVCAHVILGLPGEKREDMLNTARTLACLDIQGIKIHLMYVSRGTALEGLYEKGIYKCLGRDEYAEIAGEFLALLPPTMVIHRLTGDPHKNELVAPLWALDKQAVRDTIESTMRRKGLRQGKNY